MKKNNLSIKVFLVKFVGEICYQVCINLLETSLLANALYKFFHYENNNQNFKQISETTLLCSRFLLIQQCLFNIIFR